MNFISTKTEIIISDEETTMTLTLNKETGKITSNVLKGTDEYKHMAQLAAKVHVSGQ